jgi:flagellar hook-length control protein FliK
MVSPAVVGTGSTNKVSGTAQTKASAKKSSDFKSVMTASLANGATNGNIGKTNIKDNLINVQNTNTNKISAKNNTSEDKSSVTGSAKNADTSSISDVNSKADNKDVTDTVKEVCEDIKDAIKEEFDVSDEDIKVAMELLGLTALDLLSTAKVAELIEQLTGTDAITLITNEDMMQSFNNIINVVDEANADIAGMLGVKTEEVGIVLGQNDIAPVVNSEDTAKQDNVKESDAKNADDNINQTVDNQESLSEVLAKKITTESDGKAKNNMSESNEANNKVTYADVADNMISNITDTFADIITEGISTVKEADIVNQVIDSVKLMASRELTSMEVMLNPEHLGSVHITVTARNGIVSAQIAAQNEQVKTALENQMVTLRKQC